MNTLTDLWDAQKIVLSKNISEMSETVSLENGMGKVLSRDVYSPVDLPHFNRSTMDGFCINGSDSDFSKPFKLVGEISAFELPDCIIKANEALKVATGSMVPVSADKIVPLEYSEKKQNCLYLKDLEKHYIEFKGSKFGKSEKIFPANHKLDHRDIELLASLKISHIEVLMSPSIGIISTGGEITHLFHSEDSIVNSNFYMLTSLLKKMDVSHSYLGVVTDKKEELSEMLKTSAEKYDIVVTFGGTGFSRFDLITETINDLGGKVLIEGIDASPGKTFKFAELNDKPVFVFPGTPQSAVVTCEFFLIPFIKKSLTMDFEHHPFLQSRAQFSLTKKEGFYKLILCDSFLSNDSLFSTDRYSVISSEKFAAFRSVVIIDKNNKYVRKDDMCNTLLTYYL